MSVVSGVESIRLPARISPMWRVARHVRATNAALDLHPVGVAVWHSPGDGWRDRFQILAESHLACHTFPEYSSICLNLFVAGDARVDFAGYFEREFAASRVNVRRIERTYQEEDEPEKRELSQLRGAGFNSLV